MYVNVCRGEVADPTLYPGVLPVVSDVRSNDALPERPEADQYGYPAPWDRRRVAAVAPTPAS